jgi:flagellar hook assembly protein FlgD
VTLTAPDSSVAYTQTGDFGPGSYPIPFPGATATGSLAEGTWKLTAAATDDQGQRSTMTRSFTVDDTLGFLQTSPARLFLPPGGREMTFAWKQTRLARVVVTVETKNGSVVRTLAARRYDAGDETVAWNGLDRAGKRVKGGVYRAHLVAKSEIGTTQLARTFTVRQIAGS